MIKLLYLKRIPLDWRMYSAFLKGGSRSLTLKTLASLYITSLIPDWTIRCAQPSSGCIVRYIVHPSRLGTTLLAMAFNAA